MPSEDKCFYSVENQLGKLGNEEDYNRRAEKLGKKDNIKLNEKIEKVEKKEEPKKEEPKKEEPKKEEPKKEEPKKEEPKKEEEDKEDIEEEKEEEGGRVNECVQPDNKSRNCEDYDTKKKIESNLVKFQKIFKNKNYKEKIYIGFDKSKCNIIRIYVDKYDQNNKIKSLRVFIYLILNKKFLDFKKSIKELLKRDSISKNSLIGYIKEVIEKILGREDD